MKQKKMPNIPIKKLKDGQGQKVLLIYTGGTLGMVPDLDSGSLKPFAFEGVLEHVPELNVLEQALDLIAFPKAIDSADFSLEDWLLLVKIIEENIMKYSGMVVIHGTDTMAYTASALSFLIQNLNIPIVLTGSQLPVGIPRTDARENLISSIILAGSEKSKPSEVCIYFNGRLLRGNRAKKNESSQFDAFDSENYPYLGEVGVNIDFYVNNFLQSKSFKKPIFYHKMSAKIGVLKLFPGITNTFLNSFLGQDGLQGLVIEAYGSGTTPSSMWFLEALSKAISGGILVQLISQCTGGKIQLKKYASSQALYEMGVLSGYDMTTEAAVTKMMWAFGNFTDVDKIKEVLVSDVCGELTT